MSRLSNDKGNNRIILRGIIVIIILITLGYTVYNDFFSTDKVAVSTYSKMAPTFILSDLNGNEFDLADYKGKGVLINFWGTYCPPCEKEMPYLEKAYQDYQDQGIEVLAINVDEPMRIVNQFVLKKGLSFPILLDRHGEVTDLYNVQNLPITFLVNQDGVIEDRIFGEMNEDDIRGYMEQIRPQ